MLVMKLYPTSNKPHPRHDTELVLTVAPSSTPTRIRVVLTKITIGQNFGGDEVFTETPFKRASARVGVEAPQHVKIFRSKLQKEVDEQEGRDNPPCE